MCERDSRSRTARRRTAIANRLARRRAKRMSVSASRCDRQRRDEVPQRVIASRFANAEAFSHRTTRAIVARPNRRSATWMKSSCSTDGMLADVSERVHPVRRKPKDWSAFFFAALAQDKAIASMVRLCNLLYDSGRAHRAMFRTPSQVSDADDRVARARRRALPRAAARRRPATRQRCQARDDRGPRPRSDPLHRRGPRQRRRDVARRGIRLPAVRPGRILTMSR